MANYVTGESRAGFQVVDSGDGARLFADGGKFQTKEQMLPPLPSINQQTLGAAHGRPETFVREAYTRCAQG